LGDKLEGLKVSRMPSDLGVIAKQDDMSSKIGVWRDVSRRCNCDNKEGHRAPTILLNKESVRLTFEVHALLLQQALLLAAYFPYKCPSECPFPAL